MNITEEKKQIIRDELDNYIQRTEDIYEEMIFELSMKLRLKEETVRTVIDRDL